MAVTYNIPPFAAGQDHLLSWDFITEPDDITGWTLVLSVRERWETDVLFTLTIGTGLTVTAPLTGGMSVYFSSARTKTLTPGCYVYDIWRMDTGNTRQLTVGTLTLTPPVTAIP